MKDIYKEEEIIVPEGVSLEIKSRAITVTGPRGTLKKVGRRVGRAARHRQKRASNGQQVHRKKEEQGRGGGQAKEGGLLCSSDCRPRSLSSVDARRRRGEGITEQEKQVTAAR